MNYTDLHDFIANRMRMSHIYQPLMLMTLLRNKGQASTTKIAKDILKHDQSQIEYYQHITNNMVGKVLRKHGLVAKDKEQYSLDGFDNLSQKQVEELVELCRAKLDEYLAKRGDAVWNHRTKSSGYISGTLRYEVLKRAHFHCELCGCRADERALEVDHIVPRSQGGPDDMDNLQALCYRCNAMKRDRDNTDFRAVRDSYKHKEDGCLFCGAVGDRIVEENALAYAINDGYPVTPLHSLIIPKRHVPDYFSLSRPELNACNRLLNHMKDFIQEKDPTVVGFNIGMNAGEAAGQTVIHCHIHLIPRRAGDVENPRGGVRHTIPGMGTY